MKNINEKSISGIRIVRGSSGLTITELVIALIVLAVIIGIASHIYINYISNAQVTVANSVLDNAGKALWDYQMDNGKYPASIDFTDCVDEQGKRAIPSVLCDQMKAELSSIESYSITGTSYVLTARARDSKQTLMTLTGGKVKIQGN